MSEKTEDLTVREKLTHIVGLFTSIKHSSERQDSEGYQKKVLNALRQIESLNSIVNGLSLFSSNEEFSEINTAYLPFATLCYYEANLYQKLLTDLNEDPLELSRNPHLSKGINLKNAKIKLLQYLTQLESFGDILTTVQLKVLNSYKSSYNPSNGDIIAAAGDASMRRANKIADYKMEKELEKKLAILEEHYTRCGDSENVEDDILQRMDEDSVRFLYIDHLKLLSIYAFKELELVAMELQILEMDKSFASLQPFEDGKPRSTQPQDKFEYTSKLEANPRKQKGVSDLLNKQGKILQPFTITKTRQNLRREVFGTGQVLPSLSIEEYLDYELANGKMASGGTNTTADGDDESSTDDSDEELRLREWDDWKDDNPKGSGNMKANIG